MMPEPMKKTVDEIKVIAIREYEIKGVHYIVKAALSDNVLGKAGHCSLWKLRDRERVEHLADPPPSSSCASTCCLPIITDDLYDVGIA